MTSFAWLQLGGYFALLVGLGLPLGHYMARVYTGEAQLSQRILGPVERVFYRLLGVDPGREMGWREYSLAVLAVSAVSLVATYAIQRLQGVLPLQSRRPARRAPAPRLQHRHQLRDQHQLAVLRRRDDDEPPDADAGAHGAELRVRGDGHGGARGPGPRPHRRTASTLGNVWVDLTRGMLYVLLPLAVVLALLLVSQGVVQTLAASREVTLVEPFQADSTVVSTQVVAVGPAASQVAIKQLGTNGGGFFNVNSAHPLENPTPLSNLLELLAILLIPAALCFTFGRMVKDDRQGWAIFAAMALIFVALTIPTMAAEQAGNPALAAAGADQVASATLPGGNMEGKEVRFGLVGSALWATATTAASNGSVNSMHDSFTPLGGMVPLWLMQLGEVVFGGVGSGLYGMLIFAILAVFIAGLMVGRTPEYLGKKIEAHEMKMAALVILLPTALLLIGTAIAVVLPAATRLHRQSGGARLHRGALRVLVGVEQQRQRLRRAERQHAVLQPRRSASRCCSPGSGSSCPTLAIAGSLAAKKSVPAGPGTLPTHTPLFVALLIGTVLLVGALTHLPALALGPIVEHLMLTGHCSHDPLRDVPRAARHHPPGAPRVLHEAPPAPPAPEPGDVRGAGGQRVHPGAGRGVLAGARRREPVVHPGHQRLALVHGALRQLRRGDGRGAGQGPGRRAAPDPHSRCRPSGCRPANHLDFEMTSAADLRRGDVVLVPAGE